MRSAGHKLSIAWDPNAFFLHFEIHVRSACPIILAALQIESRLTDFHANIISDFLWKRNWTGFSRRD